jgi:hypothetical protein
VWRPERLASLLSTGTESTDREMSISIDELPRHLPDRVFVLLGKSDLFPYRIEYRRQSSASSAARMLSGGPATDSLLVMDFYRVSVGAAIDSRDFSYSPGNVPIDDRTDQFIARLTK